MLQLFVNVHVGRIDDHSSQQTLKTEVHFTDALSKNSATTAMMMMKMIMIVVVVMIMMIVME
jgi:hypothetical protein